MILAVQTPAYFAAVHACAPLLAADVVVAAESFRFSRKENVHRAAIRTQTGTSWISVPVLSRGAAARIGDMEIDRHQPWGELHRRTLEYNYHNAAWYYYYAGAVDEIIRGATGDLAGLLQACGHFAALNLQAAARQRSSTELLQLEDRNARLLAWADACGCDRALVWPHELDLLDLPRLCAAGLGVMTLEFHPAPYHQQAPGFRPGLSLLDLLFNEGPGAADHIRKHTRLREVCSGCL
ncbi:MAG TPA: WbqC family protein [bacterium]|nr:WbqC family protein [bacterium]